MRLRGNIQVQIGGGKGNPIRMNEVLAYSRSSNIRNWNKITQEWGKILLRYPHYR
jgi:hypothetical protein